MDSSRIISKHNEEGISMWFRSIEETFLEDGDEHDDDDRNDGGKEETVGLAIVSSDVYICWM